MKRVIKFTVIVVALIAIVAMQKDEIKRRLTELAAPAADPYLDLHWAGYNGDIGQLQSKIAVAVRDLKGDDPSKANAARGGLSEALLFAAQTGKVEAMAMLIDGGADVNWVRAGTKTTALHQAATGGHTDGVKLLLKHGPAVNSLDSDNCTPLYAASRIGKIETLRVLLTAKGVDPAVGFSSISVAAQEGHIDVVEALIGVKGIEINPSSGFAPLHFAAAKGRLEIAELLIENGANVDAEGDGGVTPLYTALEGGHEHVVELLLSKNAKSDMLQAHGSTLLHAAAKNGSAALVQLMLKRGIDVNVVNGKGFQAIHFAASSGSAAATKLLLDHGANQSAEVPSDLSTPLHVAAQKGHVAVINVLLDAKANPLVETKGTEVCPLYLAAQNGHFEACKVLVTRGAFVMHPAASGATPIEVAGKQGHEELHAYLTKSMAEQFNLMAKAEKAQQEDGKNAGEETSQ